MQMVYADGFVSGDVMAQDQAELTKELQAAEAEFRQSMHSRVKVVEWRSSITFSRLADYFARESRSADLIISGVSVGDLFDASRTLNTGDLVMQSGRPVLLVPRTAQQLPLEHALIGWKDTRETRRAVADALPLLTLAKRVSAVEFAVETDLADARLRMQDLATWLARHGVTADCQARTATGDDATALYAHGQDQQCDVVVAGAYGHSRLREWVLGGVTRDLLLSGNRCALLSH
jgi:nucleotide-binding universal stress UspA family protein